MIGQFFQASEIKVQFKMLQFGFIGSYFRLLGRGESQEKDSYLFDYFIKTFPLLLLYVSLCLESEVLKH